MPRLNATTTTSALIDARIRVPVAANRDRIIVTNKFDALELRMLAEGDLLAILILDYYSEAACETIAQALADPKIWTTYAAETGAASISTIGESLFGCLGASSCPDYVKKGIEMHSRLRKALLPMAYPIDRVQTELDHAWPAGAQLLRLGTNPAFSGLVRRFDRDGEAMSHQDNAKWDFTSHETAQLQSQCFINLYVSKTTLGGTVKLWDRRVATPEEYDRLRYAPGHYALDESRLGKPAAELDPPVGALLLANASKVHAVTPCAGEGVRTSVSAFFGYNGPDQALRIFS